jgi:uncharacterized protein YndB with AHSA1/START domain
MKPGPVIIERTFPAPIDKVWKAITDKELMKQWYFNLPDFKPVVGFEFEFEGGNETNKFLHKCRVTEVIPGKKLTHSWRYEGYPGNSFVTWELWEEGKDQTRVRLTHEGLDTFPATPNSDFARNNFEQGWTDIVGRSLREFLEKG